MDFTIAIGQKLLFITGDFKSRQPGIWIHPVGYLCMVINRPTGRIFKFGWPVKSPFPPKVCVAHYTFPPRSAKSGGGPGHLPTYGPG